MKTPVDLAQTLMTLAHRDLDVFHLLAGASHIADESIGFHAQQVVEKCLKAVLACHRVEVRRTHDLSRLIELLREHHLPLPPNADSLELLTPYAVMARYDVVQSFAMNREEVSKLVRAIVNWAEKQLSVVAHPGF